MKKLLTITILFSVVIILTSSFINSSNQRICINTKINKDSLLKTGIPIRIVNQYVKIRQSFRYIGKSFFIVDTRENLIYLFDENGKFFAKSPTIDGQDRQSTNPRKISEALNSWGQHVKDINFKYDRKRKKYVDVTLMGRYYSHNLVFQNLRKNKVRFFPKGVYKIKSLGFHKRFLGESTNTFYVKTLKGKTLTIAIHSLYRSKFRQKNMNKLKKLIVTDFNSPRVSKKFQNIVTKNLNNATFNNSYGCINVPFEFISLTKNKAKGAMVFVLGESESNYTI